MCKSCAYILAVLSVSLVPLPGQVKGVVWVGGLEEGGGHLLAGEQAAGQRQATANYVENVELKE